MDEVGELSFDTLFNNFKNYEIEPDVAIKNKAAFDTYRATVRGLVLNPVANPVFPDQPKGEW